MSIQQSLLTRLSSMTTKKHFRNGSGVKAGADLSFAVGLEIEEKLDFTQFRNSKQF